MNKNARRLCSKIWQRVIYPIRPYWTANIYGFGKWIRRYGYYPPILPLCVYTDHGPGDNGQSPYLHELDSSAPVQFYHSFSAVKRWKQQASKPCFQLYSPFVFARKVLRIERDKDALGTIFFVAHSTPSVEENKPVEAYHQELSSLPDKFKPVTVCLHIHDVRKGLDKEYTKLGYKVVSAGDSLDMAFTEKFYSLLNSHKYALSNLFGSYGFYAIEMGIPFGLYGSKPLYFNKHDPNIQKGEYKVSNQNPYHKQIAELFGSLPRESVTKEQYDFAAYHLGIETGVTRIEMMKILYASFFVFMFQKIAFIPKISKKLFIKG